MRSPILSYFSGLDLGREGTHDDLVLAVAVAVWEAERQGPTHSGVSHVITPGSRSQRPWW